MDKEGFGEAVDIMFFAINSTTSEKLNSLTIQENASYNLIEEDVWFADPDEIESCPNNIDIKKIRVRFRKGHRTINYNGTEYAVAPHFYIPNKSKLGINTIPESKEHKLAKNWIYNKIKNKSLSISYSSISKPYKYHNSIDLFKLPIDYDKIGIETSSSIQKNRFYRRADIICPFICKHPILGNGIIFEIQFSKQKTKTKISRELDWAIRGYSICWIFENDIELLSDILFKTKEEELRVDSFASLIKQNNKSFGRDLKTLVKEQCRKIDNKAFEILCLAESKKEEIQNTNLDTDELKTLIIQKIEDLVKKQVQPICPKCDLKMLLKGRDGNYFWGCCQYPLCKVTSSYVK